MTRYWFLILSGVVGACLWLIATPTAQAHPGHYHPPEEVDEFADEAFFEGVKHPFTGLDHLLAAFGVGSLAVAMGRQRGLATVGVFFAAMSFGFAMGQTGVGLPMLETGLALAVLGAGVLLMLQQKANSWIHWGVVALIGFWNGGAHGMEASSGVYGVGLLVGMAMIAATGALATAALKKVQFGLSLPRWSGAALMLAGLVLVIDRMSSGF